MTRTRFYVEFDDHEKQRVCFYMYSFNLEHIQTTLAEYNLIVCDQTE